MLKLNPKSSRHSKDRPNHTKQSGARQITMVLHDHPAGTMAYIPSAVLPNPSPEPQDYDDLDDVFGSAPPSPTHESSSTQGNTEWSDIPRLKEKHETEGYRDGVGKGKAETVQGGFDEGYSLGAVLGLRIGRILGLLEGISGAVRSGKGVEWDGERKRLELLVGEAKEELKTESVFGREWWGEDGIWKYEVPGEGDGRELLFPDVVSAHPLVKKWESFVQQEVKRWGLDLGIMEHDREDEHEHENGPDGIHGKDASLAKHSDETPVVATAPGAAKELSW